jgi:hypothetical protein
MAEVFLVPDTHTIPSGRSSPTLVGDATIPGALDDISDSSRIDASTTTATAINTQVVLNLQDAIQTDQVVVEYVQPVMRARRSTLSGWLTIAQVIGVDADGVEHPGTFAAGPPGQTTLYQDYTWRQHLGPTSQKAEDGTLWNECDTFKLLVTFGYPSYQTPVILSGTTPGLSYAALKVVYRVAPVATISAPSGTVTLPRTTLVWSSSDLQSAWRAILVRSDQLDAAGLPATDAAYDPTTVTAPQHDTGKVYTAVGSYYPPASAGMVDGVSYYWFVKVYSVGDYGVEAESLLWDRSDLITADLPVIATPTVTAATSEDWGTVEVTVTDAVPGGGEETPDSYVLERLETSGWAEVDAWDHGGGTRTFHDADLAFGETGQYRARALWADGDDIIHVSPWDEHTEVMDQLTDWWLRDPADYTKNQALHVASMRRTVTRPQAVEYPVEAGSKAIVTHTGSRGDTIAASLWALTTLELTRLEALLAIDRTLTLMDPSGRSWRVQPGPAVNIEIIRAQRTVGLPGTNSRKLHKIEVTFTEVDPELR